MKKRILLALLLGVLPLTGCNPTSSSTSSGSTTPETSTSETAQPVLVSQITLSASKTELIEGESVQLEAVVLPEDASDKALVYQSSDPSVATVSETGLVTAIKEGKAIITAESADAGEAKATIEITVTRKVVLVSEISLTAEKTELIEGDTVQLTATVLPEDADDKGLVYSSSDVQVATVSESGLVTALKEGIVTITAESADEGNAQTTIQITVKRKIILVSDINLTAEKTEITEGDTLQLNATVLPENADNKGLVYTSSDDKIATVSETGLVTALKEGKVTITAESADPGNAKATIDLTILRKIVLVSEIELTADKTEIEEGETVQLKATVLPENADNKALVYSSSEPAVATVSESGLVTAIKEGKATITAESADAGEAKTTIEITVNKKIILVTNIALSTEKTELFVGETTKISAVVTPEEATDKAVTFESLTPDIASVSEDGLVAALAKGTAKIAVRSADGNATAELTLTILEKDIPYLANLLGESRSLELLHSSKGTYALNETSYDWNTYSDGATQINTKVNGVLSEQVLYAMEGTSLYALDLKQGSNPSVSKDLIGTVGNEFTQEMADGYTKAFSLNGVSTVSTLALNYLTSEYFNNKEVTYSSVAEGSITTYRGETSYEEATKGEYYENFFALSFDEEGKLTSFILTVDIYDATGYDFETHSLKADAVKLGRSIAVKASVSYEERVAETADRLQEADFRPTEYEIVTTGSAWHPNNTLYVGDRVPVEVKVLAPAVHLPLDFRIEDEDIGNPSVLHLEKINGIYYITAAEAGQSTLTIRDQFDNTKSVTINVTEVPPTKIEIRANALTELEEGQSSDYMVEVSPYSTVDKSFTAEFLTPEMGNYAEIKVDLTRSCFTLTAKEIEADQQVTVIVKSTVDPSVKTEITVTIKDKPAPVTTPLDEFKASVVGNRYNYSSLHDIYFTSTTEGYVKLYGGNVYTFNWTVEEVDGFSDYRLIFTNVVQTAGSNTRYVFTGEDSPYYKPESPRESFSNTFAKDGQVCRPFFEMNGDYVKRDFKLK